MKKFIIMWDIGYGKCVEVVEVDTQEEANKEAFRACKEAFEMEAYYESVLYTDDAAKEYGLL